jgi:uncharacterized membrane protein
MHGHFEDEYEKTPPTLGQRLAEGAAAIVGSWKFIIVQSLVLLTWAYLNLRGVVHFDPYPFILLNLVLSLQAAYAGPMILMAQNRQNEKDRKALYGDYELDYDSHERLKLIEEKLDKLLKEKGE